MGYIYPCLHALKQQTKYYFFTRYWSGFFIKNDQILLTIKSEINPKQIKMQIRKFKQVFWKSSIKSVKEISSSKIFEVAYSCIGMSLRKKCFLKIISFSLILQRRTIKYPMLLILFFVSYEAIRNNQKMQFDWINFYSYFMK